MPYDLQKPVAWVGPDKADRLLISDVTPHGLHRTVVARKNEPPNMVQWLQAVMSEARDRQVHHWLVEEDSFWILWIVWKEQRTR